MAPWIIDIHTSDFTSSVVGFGPALKAVVSIQSQTGFRYCAPPPRPAIPHPPQREPLVHRIDVVGDDVGAFDVLGVVLVVARTDVAAPWPRLVHHGLPEVQEGGPGEILGRDFLVLLDHRGGKNARAPSPSRFGLGVIGLVKQEPAANDVLFRTRQVGRALWADQRHPGPAENFQALARTPRHRADVLIHSNRLIPGGIAGALVPDADGKEALIRGRPVYPFLVVRRSTLPWKVSIARFASRTQLAGQNGRGHDKSQKAQRASPVHSFILLPGKTKGGLCRSEEHTSELQSLRHL